MNDCYCRDCGAVYSETESTCPKCGTTHKMIYLSPSPAVMHLETDIAGMHAKKLHLTGKKKHPWEWTNKKTVRGDIGEPVTRYKLVDRENDMYEEVITDVKTGEILHECKEPLSQHRGHGSAKTRDHQK